LPAYFNKRLKSALQTLLDDAAAAGELPADAEAYDLLRAVANLCMPSSNGDPLTHVAWWPCWWTDSAIVRQWNDVDVDCL